MTSSSVLEQKFGSNPKTSLDVFFRPRTVAVIGASERQGSLGRVVFQNLLAGPAHTPIFAVNTTHDTVLGRKSYGHIADVPQPIDLAVIVTPAVTVPE